MRGKPIMYQFYSTWNGIWFATRMLAGPTACGRVLARADRALYLSLLNTAVLGGFMSFVYPRSIAFVFRGKYYKVTAGWRLYLSDCVIHQIPLIVGTYAKLYATGQAALVLPVMGLYKMMIYARFKNKHPYKIPERFAYIIPIGGVLFWSCPNRFRLHGR